MKGNPPLEKAIGERTWSTLMAGCLLIACNTTTEKTRFRVAPLRTSGTAATSPTLLTDPNPKDTYVNLFKWKWSDIATECTNFLGPQGFGAVQISPPAEHKNVDYWWNIYQPVNYGDLVSDMGSATELQAMIDACHAAGVRIYVDTVFNQMSADSGKGVGGSSFSASTLTYPYTGATDFDADDFHSNCSISSSDYEQNRDNVVNCWLSGMPDLRTESATTRAKIATYLTTLIGMGVDGFRIDAAKHMWPADIEAILASVKETYPTTISGEEIFITQEVIPDGTVDRGSYLDAGTLNEFQFTYAVRDLLRGESGLALSSMTAILGTGDGGGSWGALPSGHATIFVDNHDTERNSSSSLNLKTDADGKFDLANILMLASPYGAAAQLQSGFAFSFSNTDMNAPYAVSPYGSDGVTPSAVATCAGTSEASCGWDFVHRRSAIYPMVRFRAAVSGTAMEHVQTGTSDQLAFGRGAVGFVALNNAPDAGWSATLSTGLPAGIYCNVVHGGFDVDAGSCRGDSVQVDADGGANLALWPRAASPVSAVALYTGQMRDVGSAPAAPTGLTSSLSADGGVALSWHSASGASSYSVYRWSSATSAFARVAELSGDPSYVDGEPTAGETYHYFVTASNSEGESASSAVLVATLPKTDTSAGCSTGLAGAEALLLLALGGIARRSTRRQAMRP